MTDSSAFNSEAGQGESAAGDAQAKLNADIVAYWAERNKHPEYQRGLQDVARLVSELQAYAWNCAAHKDNPVFSKAQRTEMTVGLKIAKDMIRCLTAPAVSPDKDQG